MEVTKTRSQNMQINKYGRNKNKKSLDNLSVM